MMKCWGLQISESAPVTFWQTYPETFAEFAKYTTAVFKIESPTSHNPSLVIAPFYPKLYVPSTNELSTSIRTQWYRGSAKGLTLAENKWPHYLVSSRWRNSKKVGQRTRTPPDIIVMPEIVFSRTSYEDSGSFEIERQNSGKIWGRVRGG